MGVSFVESTVAMIAGVGGGFYVFGVVFFGESVDGRGPLDGTGKRSRVG